MTVSETLTALMDKARKLTGLTDKISITQLTDLMDHFDLHVNPNIFPKTEFTSKKGSEWSLGTPYPYINLKPGTYTFSWKAKTDGSNKTVRIRIFDIRANTYANFIVGPFAGKEFPLTNLTQSYTFTVPNDEHNYNVAMYGSARNEDVNSDVTFYDCKLEVGDLATPLNPVEGNLLPSQFNTKGWTIGSGIIKDSEEVNIVQLVPNNSAGDDKECSIDLTNEVDLTSTYTWTFWARADNAGDKIHTELWGGGGYSDIPLTTEWKKYQSQGKFRQEMQRLYFWGVPENKGNIYVKLPYLYKN